MPISIHVLTIAILLLLHPLTAISQDYAVSLKYTPQNILHPEIAMIPLAVELQSKRLGIEYEYGIQVKAVIGGLNYSKINQKYHRSQLTLRYYFSNKKNSDSRVNNLVPQYFIGITASHVPHQYQKEDDWYTDTNYDDYRYTSSNIMIHQWRARAICGAKMPVKKHLYLEAILGIGFMRRIVSHQASGKILVNDEFLWDEWSSPKDRREGSILRLSLLGSIRLAYKIASF